MRERQRPKESKERSYPFPFFPTFRVERKDQEKCTLLSSPGGLFGAPTREENLLFSPFYRTLDEGGPLFPSTGGAPSSLSFPCPQTLSSTIARERQLPLFERKQDIKFLFPFPSTIQTLASFSMERHPRRRILACADVFPPLSPVPRRPGSNCCVRVFNVQVGFFFSLPSPPKTPLE